MSKNIVIQEGGIGISLTVDKLKTNLMGGGTCEWIPEDEMQLGTKHITEDGTYDASDDGLYGYSSVTVSGIGKAVGKDGDGDDAMTTVDPITGELVTEKIPSSIRIITAPSKTVYTDGETIVLTGISVKGYLESGMEWGTVPTNELAASPSVAGASGGGVITGGTYNEYSSLTLMAIHPVPLTGPFYVWGITENARIVVFRGETNCTFYGVAQPNGQYAMPVVAKKTDPPTPPYTWHSDITSQTRSNPVGIVNANVVDVAWSFHPTAEDAYKYAYGEEASPPNKELITVAWARPGDGKVLTDTFEITIN